LQIADVGILPSYYPSESLPNSIVEYLDNRLPVIATDVGEVRNMIIDGDSIAGQILENITADSLCERMEFYLLKKDFFNLHKKNTSILMKKFEMDACRRSYIELFEFVQK